MSTFKDFPEFDLTGKVAIVTGGNGGIGRGIALGLARAGADIAIAARNEEKMAVVVKEVEAIGRRAIGVSCDVLDGDQIRRAVATTVAELGGVAILVNNAAVPSTGPPWSQEDWDAVFAVNARAPFIFCRAVLDPMRADGGGKIINISSGAALLSWEPSPAYGASKAALHHLTRTLATAWAHENIQVNCISPGVFKTAMSPLEDEQAVKWWISKVPARRTGDPAEFAGIAVFLASKASDYLTGQIIAFDGGVTIPSLNMQRPVV